MGKGDFALPRARLLMLSKSLGRGRAKVYKRTNWRFAKAFGVSTRAKRRRSRWPRTMLVLLFARVG